MINKIKVGTLPTTPVACSQQLYVLKAIAQWFDNTDSAIHLTKSQVSHLLAAAYGFKSYESFSMIQQKTLGDAVNLPPVQDNLSKITKALTLRLHSLGVQPKYDLFATALANYLILATNDRLGITCIHPDKSLFLHHFIKHYPDADVWGENPFLLMQWLNEVGHLGSGDYLLRNDELKQKLSYYKHSLMPQQQLLGKVFYRTDSARRYHLPVLIEAPTFRESDIVDFSVDCADFKVDSKLDLLYYKAVVQSCIAKLPAQNPISPTLKHAEKYADELKPFISLDYLREAKITKITAKSGFLSSLIRAALTHEDAENITFDFELIDKVLHVLLGTTETVKFCIYGVYNEFLFKQTVKVKADAVQKITIDPAISIGNFELNQNSDSPLLKHNIETSIRLKRNSVVISDDKISSVIATSDIEDQQLYQSLIELHFKQLNKFIFGNKYPVYLGYEFLYQKYMQHHLALRPVDEPESRQQNEALTAPSSNTPKNVELEPDFDLLESFWETSDSDELVDLPEPKINYKVMFRALKGLSKKERIKLKRTFVGRYQLVYQSLDATQPPVSLQQHNVVAMMDGLFMVINSKGYTIPSREFNQKELDLLSDLLNYLISKAKIANHTSFGLKQGRFRLLKPNHKQKPISEIKANADQEQLEKINAIKLTRAEKGQLFDGGGGAKPVVMKRRFDDFYKSYFIASHGKDGEILYHHKLKHEALYGFMRSLTSQIKEYGMPKNHVYGKETLRLFNRWMNQLIKADLLELPDFFIKPHIHSYSLITLKHSTALKQQRKGELRKKRAQRAASRLAKKRAEQTNTPQSSQ